MTPTRKKDVACLLFFLFLWTAPHIYTNLTGRPVPFFPKPLNNLYRTSYLFTRANFHWPMLYIQVQYDNGPWQTLPEEEYFAMRPFGYRSRLFEAVFPPEYSESKSLQIQKDIAGWVYRRYQRMHPDKKVFRRLRLAAGLHTARPGQGVSGHWQKPAPETFGDQLHVLSVHEFTK